MESMKVCLWDHPWGGRGRKREAQRKRMAWPTPPHRGCGARKPLRGVQQGAEMASLLPALISNCSVSTSPCEHFGPDHSCGGLPCA